MNDYVCVAVFCFFRMGNVDSPEIPQRRVRCIRTRALVNWLAGADRAGGHVRGHERAEPQQVDSEPGGGVCSNIIIIINIFTNIFKIIINIIIYIIINVIINVINHIINNMINIIINILTPLLKDY